MVDINGSGLSILEISHRSAAFQDVMDEAQSLVKELYGLPEGYEVMFLQGGASSQFFMAPLNFLGKNERAGYIDTGSWSSKAIKEAKAYGDLFLIASSKDKNYTYIPKNLTIPGDLKYVHITSNNTIMGTQFHEFPETSIPLVADMSSDILSKAIDVSRFGLIYAGAQKNLGPAGTTLVIANREFTEKTVRETPTMLDYRTHIDKGSMFNTPPVFAIYVSMLTLRWIKEKGGLDTLNALNVKKANYLYNILDESDMFYGTALKDDRSLMNINFLLHQKDLEPKFLKVCEEGGCVGVKGHRSVGGFRASIYNSMPIESVKALGEIIQEFEKSYG